MIPNPEATLEHLRSQAATFVPPRLIDETAIAACQSVHHAASKATQDLQAHLRGEIPYTYWRVVNNPTGTGKTMGMLAYIAAAVKADPDFTCAVVVETVLQADDVGAYLRDFCGEQEVVVWTGAHDIGRTQESPRTTPQSTEFYEEQYGELKCPFVHPAELKTARVIVVTHKKWLIEHERDADYGVRFYRPKKVKGKEQEPVRRTVTFVDESPNLTHIREASLVQFVWLHEMLAQNYGEGDPRTKVAKTVVERASGIVNTPQSRIYSAPTLVKMAEMITFVGWNGNNLQLEDALWEVLRDTLSVLWAAAKGCAFFDYSHRLFFTYEYRLDVGPGHVCMDGTADLSWLIHLSGDAEEIRGPAIDYSPLKAEYIPLPEKFRYFHEVQKSNRLLDEMGAWLRATVIENTEGGDEVLIVCRNALRKQSMTLRSEPMHAPFWWEGRKIWVLNWGTAVGSNRYNGCNVVVLVDNFWLPKSVIMATAASWLRKKITKPLLDEANGHGTKEDRTLEDAQRRHCGRWRKQMASRGNLRNIKDGKCGPMRLLYLGNEDMAAEHPELFPGSTLPQTIGAAPTGHLALVGLLEERRPILTAEMFREVGRSRLYLDVQSPTYLKLFARYGYEVAKAKDVGMKGKGIVLKLKNKLPVEDAA